MSYFNIESKRLRFRKLSLEDIPVWSQFFINNGSLSYLGLDLNLSPETNAESWISRQLERYETQGWGHLAAELKSTGDFIGMGGILPQEINGKPEFEIAYSLLPAFWGKGYGTEIAEQMKCYGFVHLDVPRLVSVIDIRNQRSIKVAMKNGMEPLFRTKYFDLDVDVYGINRDS